MPSCDLSYACPQNDDVEFFMPMVPPTITYQQHKVTVQNGKPRFYEPPELKEARAKLVAYLSPHKPDNPLSCGVRLTVKWLFPNGDNHADGEYRITKPDTDNLEKLLKDCMTKVGFWKDDALVASEVCEKFWAKTSGIYIKVEPL